MAMEPSGRAWSKKRKGKEKRSEETTVFENFPGEQATRVADYKADVTPVRDRAPISGNL